MVNVVTQAKKEVNKLTKPVMKILGTTERAKTALISGIIGMVLGAIIAKSV